MRVKVNVRDFISQKYMGMNDKELADLDRQAEKTLKASMKELKEAPWDRNDHYQKDEIVETVSGDPTSDDEKKGGED